MAVIHRDFHPRQWAGQPVVETEVWRQFPSRDVKVKDLNRVKHVVTVVHIEDYGVLVVGCSLVSMARHAMRKVGYDGSEMLEWAYRPTMVDQVWSADGHAVAGRPAVAFYFNG